MAHLGYEWGDIENAIGLPIGWTDVAPVTTAERLGILSKEFDTLDSNTIDRIANGNIQCNGERLRA